MSTHKHRKLKRHPIVRFIRGVFRLFRILFKPKRTISRLDLSHPAAIEARIEAISFDRDPVITEARIEATSIDRDSLVVEERIEATNIDRHQLVTEEISKVASVDRDQLVTVGDIFARIKWQAPPPQIQKEFTSNSMLFKPNNASRN
jgi:hypothetical protein